MTGIDVNSVAFTGLVCSEPEQRELPDGTMTCRLRVAVRGAARNGGLGFVDVVERGPRAGASASSLGIGWLIGFDGRLEHRRLKSEGTEPGLEVIGFVGRLIPLAPPQATDEDEAPHDLRNGGAERESDDEPPPAAD